MRSAPTAVSVPFNRPYTTGAELAYIEEAIEGSHLSGNGPFSARCSEFLESLLGAERVAADALRAPARWRWQRCSPGSAPATRW